MPTYEYVCRGCKYEFEKFQPITAAAVKTCPKCKRKRVERKIGIGAGVLFKGGGFYETDYRSEGYRKAEAADKKPDATVKETKGAETKSAETKSTETKPAETKSTETKSTETKSTETKPQPTPPPTAKPESPPQPPTKSDARAGRGVGNVLQLGRRPKSGRATRKK